MKLVFFVHGVHVGMLACIRYAIIVFILLLLLLYTTIYIAPYVLEVLQLRFCSLSILLPM